MAVTSSSLNSGASIAAGSALVVPPTITRADLSPIRPSRRLPEDNRSSIAGMKFPMDVGKYYMKIDINTYDRSAFDAMIGGGGFGAVAGGLQYDSYIVLPLPLNIADTNSVAYSEDSMGDVVGGVVDAASSFLKNTLGENSIIGGIAGNLLQSSAKVGYAASGITSNKFMTVVLQGPQYKKHTFSWKLYPRSAQESKVLQIIIKKLRESMRTNIALGGAFFNFPKVFKMSFSPNEKYLFEFKPAVLESMRVNYAPSGSPSFYGKTGAPDGIELTLNFHELEYWLNAEDYSTSLNAQLESGAITQEEFDSQAGAAATGTAPELVTPGGQSFGGGGN